MDKQPPSSIFDQAGKKNPQPSKKIPEKTAEKEALNLETSKIVLTDAEVQRMFDRMVELKEELDKKTDEFKEAVVLSQQDVVKYFNEPKNFTIDQWAVIQESRSELEKRVFDVVGKDLKKVRQKQLESKDSKLRKGKTLGARRNWIPIR
ncbi:MAG TPA: hypothetical protein PLC42_04980 [Parachlamydiaceae bacterium]|nr:hypothetical protein [Parachlamydiaceae bacterium]